jgi:hypothetical protein
MRKAIMQLQGIVKKLSVDKIDAVVSKDDTVNLNEVKTELDKKTPYDWMKASASIQDIIR